MKRSRFLALTISSMVVLIAIILVQAYWLDHTAVYQKKRFDRRVGKALDSVVKKLENKSTVSTITTPVYRISDSKNGISYIDKLKDTVAVNKITNNSADDSAWNEEFQIEMTKYDLIDSSITIVKKSQKRVLQSTTNMISNSAKEGDMSEESSQKDGPTLFNNIVKEFSFISIKSGVKHKVDFHLLDSLVKQELDKKEIYVSAITDVIDPKTNSLTVNEKSSLREDILDSPYRVELFANDYLLESDILVLYFPEKPTIFLKSFWNILILSLLIIVVLATFIYISLSTILKQKKIGIIKNDFINNMTHELKTPISTISLACEALRDPTIKLSKDRQQVFVKMIQDENKRLYLLVDNVLKSAMWDQPSFNIDKELFSLQGLVEEVTDSFRLQVESKGGALTKEFLQQEDQVFADKVHIANVIYNLLDNANKYNDKTPQINVMLQNINNEIELVVEDNGIGISEEDKKRIFQKFYRVPSGDVHNTKGFGLGLNTKGFGLGLNTKGFGLGLNYVKSIIEKHEGTIIIHSQIGKGTTCRVRIPIYKPK